MSFILKVKIALFSTDEMINDIYWFTINKFITFTNSVNKFYCYETGKVSIYTYDRYVCLFGR
jgi:hypothetical protein